MQRNVRIVAFVYIRLSFQSRDLLIHTCCALTGGFKPASLGLVGHMTSV